MLVVGRGAGLKDRRVEHNRIEGNNVQGKQEALIARREGERFEKTKGVNNVTCMA